MVEWLRGRNMMREREEQEVAERGTEERGEWNREMGSDRERGIMEQN